MDKLEQQYFDLLDNDIPPRTDVLFVLRNWGKPETDIRMDWATNMLRQGLSNLLIHVYEQHTRAEADRAMVLAAQLGWSSLTIVTSKSHHYRAFLTFVKAMEAAGIELKLYCSAASGTIPLSSELAKIEQYQKSGDVASYEIGIRHIRGR